MSDEGSPGSSLKRKDYIGWEDYFMGIAFLAAKRSKDPVRQVGACIVSEDNKIVGVGYNGFPKGCSDDTFPWGKHNASPLNNKYLYVCHAEVNAILNKNISDLKGCRMYVALFPCNECAKVIIQSGISKIIYMSDKNSEKVEYRASKRMLKAANVSYVQFEPNQEEIVINFNDINAKSKTPSPNKKQRVENGTEDTLSTS